MYKFALFFAIFLAKAYTCDAQITLTAVTSTPLPGDTAIYYRDYNGSNPGAAGANITWDFSYLLPGQRDTIYYVDSLSGCIFLPAQLHAYTANEPCLFYNFDSSSLHFRGETTSWSYVSYSNPLLVLQFPMSYNGNVYTDSFYYGGSDGSIVIEGYGQLVVHADAYGTLILPDTTYYNVLRVKKEITVKKSYLIIGMGNPLISTDVNEYYEWYSDVASRTYLLQVSKHISTTGIKELNTEHQNVQVYPNPASDKLNISWKDCNANYVRVKDITGKTLKSISCQKDKTDYTIAVSDMSAGLYLLSIETATGTIVKKIQVQH